MKKSALIIVDFEQEWINRDSEYYIGDISPIIKKVNKLIDFCRIKGCKIIFTRHIEKGSQNAFAESSENVELIPGLHKEKGDVLVTKHKISPFYQTGLEEELRGIDKIVVAGVLTNLCVRSTVEDAYDRDFEIEVIKDCCVAFDKQTHNFTFKDLKNTREEIKFLNLNEFIK